MNLLDRWPGDPGRKQRPLKPTKPVLNPSYHVPDNNVSLAGPTVTTVTTTGSTRAGTAVITLDSSCAWTQPTLPAQSALHNSPRLSIVSTAVVFNVTDAAQHYSSILEATTNTATVTGSCARPVMSVSVHCSSSIHQLNLLKWRENTRQWAAPDNSVVGGLKSKGS